MPLRRDGLPLAARRLPDDKGVAVYFSLKGQPLCFASDRWDAVEDNMQAIRRTMRALRGIAALGQWKHGGTSVQWFPLLTWNFPLGRSRDERGATKGEIEAAYRKKAKLMHPDCGGSDEAMSNLNRTTEALRTAA